MNLSKTGQKFCIAVILCLLVACVGTGCKKQSETPDGIRGTVIEVQAKHGTLLVELNADSLYGNTLARLSVNNVKDFKVGDHISFSSCGDILEQYPLIFTEVQDVQVVR